MMEENQYGTLPDEQLLALIKNGDEMAEETLYTRYKQVVRSRARTYFLVGADHEDLLQEGMIGLYRAVCDYQPEKQVAFSTFAEMCIQRQLITAITRANRKKHAPLNNYVSFSRPLHEEDGEGTIADMLRSSRAMDPEETLIGRENYEALAGEIEHELSPLERDALMLYIEGKTYQQIAQELNRSTKSIDNAIQRVKKKLEEKLKS